MPSISVGTAPVLLVEANEKRLSIVIYNAGPSGIFYGQTASITTADSPCLATNGSFEEDSGGTKIYCGAFYGIASSGTSDVRVWERIR